ncbi:MAG: 30S ribosome-binding factor RbfA [Gammaproteobacteria bacterium]
MPHEFSRAERIAEAIHRDLAPLLQTIAQDNALGLLSIAGVEVTPDLRFARVYVSQLGASSGRERMMQVLEEEVGRCRRHLARGLRLRYVPRLVFSYDDSAERAAHLTELLRKPEQPGRRAPRRGR